MRIGAEGIQGVGRKDFVDEGETGIEEQTIPTGRGKVKSRSRAGRPLEPESVSAGDGRVGWRVRLPGGRPLATPAILGDAVYLGGGFGSHDFYGFDAAEGDLRWRLRTKDDGPTAAVASDGFIAFNTESCTIHVVDARTGRVVWEEWLGDPLMAQPAIDRSTVFMAYPDRRGRHLLAAFDLETGKRRWETEIIADVITAPVLAEDAIYAAALDGTVYRIDRDTGERRWSLAARATSAPWIHRGKIHVSLRDESQQDGGVVFEGHGTAVIDKLSAGFGKAFSRRRAEYLREKRAGASAFYDLQDADVGFATAPAAAKLSMAAKQLGTRRVSGVWAFQGSRPEVFDDGIYSTLDEVVQRVDRETKKPLWRARLESAEESGFGRALSPPAVTADRLYLTSVAGDLIVLERSSGECLWTLNVGAPILSQPAVAGGNVYFGTADGVLYAFAAGDTDLRGWPMWGGGPGHNGLAA